MVEAILILTVLETAGLWAYHRFTGRGLKPQDYMLNMVYGLGQLTGIKTVVMGANWPLTALFLMAAGCPHGADLWLRLRARSV